MVFRCVTTKHSFTGNPQIPSVTSRPVAEPTEEVAEPTDEEAAPIAEPPVEHYDDLEAAEVISLLGSLEASDLEALRDYEREAKARDSVIAAIEAVLARRATRSRP